MKNLLDYIPVPRHAYERLVKAYRSVLRNNYKLSAELNEARRLNYEMARRMGEERKRINKLLDGNSILDFYKLDVEGPVPIDEYMHHRYQFKLEPMRMYYTVSATYDFAHLDIELAKYLGDVTGRAFGEKLSKEITQSLLENSAR